MFAGAVAAVLMQAAPGAAPTQPVEFLRRPTAEHLAQYFPARARQEGVEGQATIECRVTDGGSMADCRVVSEAPVDYGFGEAALAMTQYFSLHASSGRPAGGPIQLPIRFRLPPKAVTPASPAAPPPAGAPSLIVSPDWMRVPSAQDLAKYFPQAAIGQDLAGRAVISCSVTADGRLINCTTISEDPPEAGFDAAALAMSDVFRMRPQTRDGKKVEGGTVRIPIVFLKPADLRAAPVRARFPDVKGEIVELDCRFRGAHLDNCFARGGSTAKATEVALEAAKGITLPPLPSKRTQGRIILPIVFVDDSGQMTTPEVVTRPRWRRRPSATDVHRVYPDAAKTGNAPAGNVVVECRFTGKGDLADCVVSSETPAGLGFGPAAMELMKWFQADEVDAFGLKIEGRKIRIPIRLSPTPPPTRGTGN